MICMFKVLWLLVYAAVDASPGCNTFSDCVNCTNHDSWSGSHCRWCPLDEGCHAHGSLLNPCREDQNIVEPSKCYDTGNGTYKSELAFSNMLLSAVAYSKNQSKCIERIYPGSGFKVVKTFSENCEDMPLFSYRQCFAYVAVSPKQKMIALAYRGTDFTNGSKQLYDEMISVLTLPKVPFPAGGTVQDYFSKAHDRLYSKIRLFIKDLVPQYPGYSVAVTGHSLGAALASMSALMLVWEGIAKRDTTTFYSFGLPRVGNKGYALVHDRLLMNSWRVVHARDIVSHIPTCNLIAGCSVTSDGPYHHGVEIYYPDVEMNVGSPYKRCHGDEDENCSNGAVEKKWCTPGKDLDECIANHKHYFGFWVGGICKFAG